MTSTSYKEQRRVMMVTEARQAEDGSAHRMVIAANEVSRNGDELNLRGINFKNYRKNPVVLWSHDSYGGIPIAKTLKIGHDDQGRIEADFEFNSEDEFAARVENGWNNGFIRSASIRYLPTKVVEVRNEEGRVERLRIEESELLEWSLVPVPADPDSVRAAARALGLPAEIFRGLEPEPEPELSSDPVTSEPEPEPEPRATTRSLSASMNGSVSLEEEFRALAAKTSEEKPQETPSPDPVLVAVEAEFAAMRQIIADHRGEATMTTDTEKLMENVAAIHAFTETFKEKEHTPLKEEVERLSAQLTESMRASKRAALLRQVESTTQGDRVLSGKYRGFDEFDLMLSRAVLRIAERGGVDGRRPVDPRTAAEWRSNLEVARADLYESIGRALDASTAGAGDELTFTGETSEMWRDVHLATSVVSLFGSIMMPTDPFRIPYDFGDVSWYRGTSNLAVSSSTPGTGRQTLTSAELAAMIGWSYDLDEDAVIAVLPELRATLVRNAAEVLDDVVLNGDTSDDATNINADGATADSLAGSAGLDHYLVFDGLIHIPLVDNTNQGNDHGAAVSDDMFNEARAKLGKYGVRPSECAFVMDINTYIRALSIENFRTVEKLGPNATLLTGQLGDIEGIPVIISEQMLLADIDGKVSSGGNATDTGRVLAVNRNMYRLGFKRELMIESERDIQKRQTVLVASMSSVAFEGRMDNASDTAVALQYNITGVY